MKNANELPPDLPRPLDDGACNHLVGMNLPSIHLETTTGDSVDLSELFQNPSVLFIFPRAGSSLEPNMNPDLWDRIPGARGCTPQSCGFRDNYQTFEKLGYAVYGLSMQSVPVLQEIALRNELPFKMLSDSNYLLTNALKLPTFIFEGDRLIKRMALVIRDAQILKVFYPVFPPNENATEVLSWLRSK